MIFRKFSQPLTVMALIVVASLGLTAQRAEAVTVQYNGTVDAVAGALGGLVGLGSAITGDFVFNSPGPGGTTMNTADITDLLAFATPPGQLGFCFELGTLLCPVGAPGTVPSVVPINAINSLDLTFDAQEVPSAGLLSIKGTSPTFGFSFDVIFDVTAGTFLVDANDAGFGQVSGPGSFSVVPVPGAVWLFGSALLGLIGVRRRIS